ncbi:HBL/NHE enterotoxin family protein [Corallococcus macrosporus]|uniref:HBL/NHE enterotoxin family protein n=1 Tax=Corallococcus macrosporus TaxID=35 RepID=A0ABS3DPH1_9BACT|nr:HBL/NHE enterotoxin family protein [Corallococcus macrosporus]MBN8233182.1 HBL/NHE enterotoxin family protein [Corallococcus macrosporus]
MREPSPEVFSPEPLTTALAGLGAAGTTLQMYAQALVQQPVVGMASVPSLATDLGRANAVARACLGTVMPQALKLDAATLGFVHQLMAMYPRLQHLAKTVDQGGPAGSQAALELSQGLDLLAQFLARQGDTVAVFVAEAHRLSTETTKVSDALAADAVAAAGDAEIASLEAQISQTLAAIDQDCQTIAKGLSGTDKALVQLAIKMYNCEDSPVAAAKAFVGLIVNTANTSGDVIAAQHDVERQLQTLTTLYSELNPLLAEAAVAQTASQEAALMAQSTVRMQQAANDMGRAWAALIQGYASLSKALQQGTALPPLEPALAENKAGWQFLLDECTAWQRVGLFPVVLLQPTTDAAA